MNGSSATPQFRKMQLEDLDIVHAIDVESFSLPWPKISFMHEITKNEAARFWVAEIESISKNAQIAGMLGGWLIIDEFHIGTIAIKKEFRRQHFGEKMLIHGIQQVYDEGARSVFLEVRESNQAAQSMYKKLGFQVEGNRPRYYSDNHENAIIMNLRELNQDKIISWQSLGKM